MKKCWWMQWAVLRFPTRLAEASRERWIRRPGYSPEFIELSSSFFKFFNFLQVAANRKSVFVVGHGRADTISQWITWTKRHGLSSTEGEKGKHVAQLHNSFLQLCNYLFATTCAFDYSIFCTVIFKNNLAYRVVFSVWENKLEINFQTPFAKHNFGN